MRILFVGPYRQCDGWGGAAKDYLGALLRTGHDVSAKPIYLSSNLSNDIPKEIEKAEQRIFDKRPDVIIQNTLPSVTDYQHGMKNICLLYLETDNIIDTGWIYRLNLLDEVWVGSKREQHILQQCGIKIPVRIIRMPFDSSRLQLDAKPMDIPDTEGCFIFYFIGEYIERKNIKALSMAFHREFHPTEPVRLILKLHKTGYEPHVLQTEVSSHLNALKTHMRLYGQSYGYIPEFSITDRLSEQEMCELHSLGDCLVIPSRGESLCRPVMDAMYMGNNVIVTDKTGMVDTVGSFGHVVKSHKVPVLVGQSPIDILYTSRETWQEIDILHLQSCMRKAYNNKDLQDKDVPRKSLMRRFSYDTIAKQIQKVLG